MTATDLILRFWTMELVRWLLGALAAHLEDLGSTPPQHAPGGAQPTVTPVAEDLAPSSGYCWYCIHVMHSLKVHIYFKRTYLREIPTLVWPFPCQQSHCGLPLHVSSPSSRCHILTAAASVVPAPCLTSSFCAHLPPCVRRSRCDHWLMWMTLNPCPTLN